MNEFFKIWVVTFAFMMIMMYSLGAFNVQGAERKAPPKPQPRAERQYQDQQQPIVDQKEKPIWDTNPKPVNGGQGK